MTLLSTLLMFVLQVAVKAPREGGVVTGVLLSTGGLPAGGVRVSAVAAQDPNARDGTPSTIVSSALTDESGRYRLENVSPGRYFITAGLVDAPTYYPGVTAPSQAQIISIAANAPIGGVDFKIVLPAGVRVAGRVLSPQGRTFAGTLPIILVPENGFIER